VLLEREPHLHGVLFDLPAVVARAPAHERLSVVGGDAFTAIPDGCDVYLFVNVLHDWDDGDAARLLRNVPRGTKTIVVEAERRTRPIDGITARTDLLMLALAPGGRERSAEEFARLARSGGGVVDRSVRLVSGDRAIVISS
jgi:hypothetical protein